jgi:hypothetical protein
MVRRHAKDIGENWRQAVERVTRRSGGDRCDPPEGRLVDSCFVCTPGADGRFVFLTTRARYQLTGAQRRPLFYSWLAVVTLFLATLA